MSALAWLFGLGAAAVVFPVIFHLIRRTPQGQTEFSSLMFLKPSPPTLTRRSRLDNLWLLLMRALAICLLAIAFMRPFFTGSQTTEFDVQFRRVAILVDTSASMRRADIWDNVRVEVKAILSKLEAEDQIALYAFDRDLRPLVPFGDAQSSDYDRGAVLQAIREKMEDLNPTWAHSDLGNALVGLADQLDDWNDTTRNDEGERQPKLQLYVISDMQSGSATEALHSYQWPAMVKAEFKSVHPTICENATLNLLTSNSSSKDEVRVRVSNLSATESEVFQVSWKERLLSDNQRAMANRSDGLTFVVGPGASRVLPIPAEQVVNANKFQLSGDQERFDNSFFTSPIKQRTIRMVYIGNDDPDDPETNLFYLARAFSPKASRKYDIFQFLDSELPETVAQLAGRSQLVSGDRNQESDSFDPSLEAPAVLVLAREPDAKELARLQTWLEAGATLFVIANSPAMVSATTELTGAKLIPAAKANANDSVRGKPEYSMLADMDLSDPLLGPFLDPRFSDFTGIRFWNHQQVQLEDDAKRVASFDDRSPAIWSMPHGKGEVIGFSSSWRPRDSQWFLDPKFVVFFLNLFELKSGIPPTPPRATVGDTLRFAASEQPRSMIRPDRSILTIDPNQTQFNETDIPGVYLLSDSVRSIDRLNETQRDAIVAKATQYAVNVDRRESETDLLAIEQLERLNVQVGQHQTAEAELAQFRQLRDRDLENKQKIWKWLIVLAIGLLILETYYAGRKAKGQPPISASATT